jgi:hypothetical protein
MKLIPIKVESYPGQEGGEYPVSFYWRDTKYEIKEIADRWYQAHPDPGGPVANYFKVRTASKSIFIIKHVLESDDWFLVAPEEPVIGFSFN